MLKILVTGLLLIGAPAFAGELSVLDGDTIRIGAVTYRLHGIDAPEKAQGCPREGVTWLCGAEAAKYLRTLVEGREIACEAKERDRYGRTVAVCRAGGLDLNREMVRAGLAWAYVQYSSDYADSEAEARISGRGIWTSEAVPAWEWRKGMLARGR